MNKVKNKIAPTLTLAQLYETQKQYFDAYLSYKFIYDSNADDMILEKMEKSKSRIFEDPALQYNEIINTLFTVEDKTLFRVLPEKLYDNYLKSFEDKVEEQVFVAEEFEEDENDMSEAETLELVYEPNNITEVIEEASKTNDNSDIFDIKEITKVEKSLTTIADFCKFLTEHFGDKKIISDINLAELFFIIDRVKSK